MNISFISNFMNHHQLPFCTELTKLCSGAFTFWATTPLPEEQAKLGYKDFSDLSFVTEIYDNDENYQKCCEAMKSEDFVIFGMPVDELMDIRQKAGKPYAIFSERVFKKSLLRRFIPTTKRKLLNRFKPCESTNACVLASSAYLAYDISLLNIYPTVYRWGYFPNVKKYDDIDKLIENKKKNSILWVARFLDWKHPELAVKLAERLKNDGISFTLNMIGIGDEFEKIKKMIDKKALSDCVHLLGSMPPDEVRKHMEESEIYLFASDKMEGWGAVLNESMNSACAVVASNEPGSVPFLIDDNDNGLIYSNGNFEELYKKVKFLIDNPEQRGNISKKAYASMMDLWNAKVAAARLYNVIDAMVNNKQIPICKTGPCSIAEIIPEKRR